MIASKVDVNYIFEQHGNFMLLLFWLNADKAWTAFTEELHL